MSGPDKNSQPRGKTTTNELFKAAVKNGLSASLARTLAECLYWSQHTTRRISGRPALYKTGSELSGVLGISARTANSHLKRLAKEGFWSIAYRPRPHHPSPVTWLVIEPRAQALIHLASRAHVSQGNSDSIEGDEPSALIGEDCDVRTLEIDTIYNDSPDETADEKDSFVRRRKQERTQLANDRRSGNLRQKLVGGRSDVREFVDGVMDTLRELRLPAWDTSSRYTWGHAERIHDQLLAAGYRSVADKLSMVEQIVSKWPELRPLMEPRYVNHAGNELRPTPMALADQVVILLRRLQDEDEWAAKNSDSSRPWSNLNGDFG